jgi:hypothetical protein
MAAYQQHEIVRGGSFLLSLFRVPRPLGWA